MRRTLILVIASITLVASGRKERAWARHGEPPWSQGAGTSMDLQAPVESLPPIDAAALRSEPRDPSGPLVFATSAEVFMTPATHGRWIYPPDGGSVWRLRLEAPGATDLNLGFTLFDLPSGATLYVMGEEEEFYQGPYTSEDQAGDGELWTPVVPGSRATVELFVPDGAEFEPRLALTRVGRGFRDLFQRESNGGLRKQGSCNIDVACPQGDPYRDQIRSVAAYSFGGTLLCTATLVMNTSRDFTPLMLTAFHCGITPTNASSIVVYWNFESPSCGDLSGGDLTQNSSGAMLRARHQDDDMALFELDAVPDPSYHVYYAGWDRTGNSPATSFAIHHPRGDEKALSINTDPLTTQDCCIENCNGHNTHWRVGQWEQGTTEPGSSGSALFHGNSRRVVGYLTGGAAACDNPNGYDCFGKLSVAWDAGSSSGSRLREWLDPLGTGESVLNGADPVTWVDFSYTGVERGTYSFPYATYGQAAANVPTGGRINILPGTSSESAVAQRASTVHSYGGTAVIGH
jgi:hypothetical protein